MSALTELYEQIAACQKCDIARSRTRAVPGEGPENAGIMFIGEAPGFHEDQQGRPFVGPAGQFLEKLLASVNLKREQVYITNVIKTRPTNNREPLPTEIRNCRPYLEKQIELIHPRMIVTLGRYSMASFFPDKAISKHPRRYLSDAIGYTECRDHQSRLGIVQGKIITDKWQKRGWQRSQQVMGKVR